MTFNESPRLLLEPHHPGPIFAYFESFERERKLKREGVEELYLLDFSSHPRFTAEEFATYIKAMNAKIIVAGFDYTFWLRIQNSRRFKGLLDGEVISCSTCRR